jgi:hypothetical protein
MTPAPLLRLRELQGRWRRVERHVGHRPEAVDHDGGGARRAQPGDLGGRPRGRGYLMAGRDEQGDKVYSQGTGRARDEDSHDLSLRLLFCPPRQDSSRSCDTS